MPTINTKFISEKIPKHIYEKSCIYLVGGSVRDQLLGRTTADWDLAVEKDPEDIARAIARAEGARAVFMGKGNQFVYRVAGPRAIFDVAPIQGRNISEDLLRRDFTVNAMAALLPSGRIIDPAGGQRDLEKGIIRMVGQHVLDADSLRLLRAFRMAAVLGFEIEPGTFAAISRKAENIRKAAGERIRDEWVKILKTADSALQVFQMDRAGILGAVFPELSALKGCTQNRYHDFDVFDHTLAVYANLEKMLHKNMPAMAKSLQNSQLQTYSAGIEMLKQAALLHDTGKPRARSIDKNKAAHFYHHPLTGAQMAESIHNRLRFSNADTRYVTFLIRNHLKPLFLYNARENGKMTNRAITRFFIKTSPHTPDLLMLAAADMMGKRQIRDEKFLEFAGQLIETYRSRHLPATLEPPLITGHDLIRYFNLSPSPLFAQILSQIEETRLCREVTTRQQALGLARKIIESKLTAS